jgi:hypothetical protein
MKILYIYICFITGRVKIIRKMSENDSSNQPRRRIATGPRSYDYISEENNQAYQQGLAGGSQY